MVLKANRGSIATYHGNQIIQEFKKKLITLVYVKENISSYRRCYVNVGSAFVPHIFGYELSH